MTVGVTVSVHIVGVTGCECCRCECGRDCGCDLGVNVVGVTVGVNDVGVTVGVNVVCVIVGVNIVGVKVGVNRSVQYVQV